MCWLASHTLKKANEKKSIVEKQKRCDIENTVGEKERDDEDRKKGYERKEREKSNWKIKRRATICTHRPENAQ